MDVDDNEIHEDADDEIGNGRPVLDVIHGIAGGDRAYPTYEKNDVNISQNSKKLNDPTPKTTAPPTPSPAKRIRMRQRIGAKSQSRENLRLRSRAKSQSRENVRLRVRVRGRGRDRQTNLVEEKPSTDQDVKRIKETIVPPISSFRKQKENVERTTIGSYGFKPICQGSMRI